MATNQQATYAQQNNAVTYGRPVQPQAQPLYQPAPNYQAQATYQPAYQPQTTVVVSNTIAPNDGSTRAIIIFIVGWFFFPVWWFACCHISRPGISPLAKILNIVSTVLGILGGITIPLAIILDVVLVTSAIPSYSNTGTLRFSSGGSSCSSTSCGYQCMNSGFTVTYLSGTQTLTSNYAGSSCSCGSGTSYVGTSSSRSGSGTFSTGAAYTIYAYTSSDIEIDITSTDYYYDCADDFTFKVSSGTVMGYTYSSMYYYYY